MFNDTQGKKVQNKMKSNTRDWKTLLKKNAIMLYSNNMGYKIQLRLFATMIVIWPIADQKKICTLKIFVKNELNINFRSWT